MPLARSLVVLLALSLVGCPGPRPEANPAPGPTSLAGVKLRLLVVDDPELAAAAGRLRGEWNAQTGGEFEVELLTNEQPDGTAPLAADRFDAVVCPSHQLGPLAERGLLGPISEETLEGNFADWSDVFALLRRSEATWIDQTLGVPFGSPVLVCYYRADLLERLGRQPPKTWAEYRELADLLADRKNLGDAAPAEAAPWHGTLEPLAPGWAGLVLLARAAPYAKHRDDYSTLFDIRTMEPLVAGPPFVRALEELVVVARQPGQAVQEQGSGEDGAASPDGETVPTQSPPAAAPDPLQYNPADARAAFWRGECGMALTWPTAAATDLPAERPQSIQVGFARLPGSSGVYNLRRHAWERRADDEDPHVPLLAMAGRLGAVSRKSSHPEAACELLLWLSGKQFGPRVSASSTATTLYRQSYVANPRVWVEPPVGPPAAAQYASVAKASFSGDQWVFALRIPGRQAYLTALDDAIDRAVRGEQSPAEALQQAAARWREITDELGLEAAENGLLPQPRSGAVEPIVNQRGPL